TPRKALQPRALVEPHQPCCCSDALRVRQDMAKDEAARQTREDGPAVVLFDLGPRNFHQLAVFDARGARRLARAAVQAPIDVPDEPIAQLTRSLLDRNPLP